MFCRSRAILGIAVLAFSPWAWGGRENPAKPGEEIVPQQFIVKMKAGVPLASILANYMPGATLTAQRAADVFLVRVPAGTSDSASTQLAAHVLVDYVEPDRIRRTTLQSPNDPQLGSQWALSAIQAAQAW